MPGVTDIRVTSRPGDLVRPLTVSGNRLGYLIACGADGAQAARNAEAAVARIRIATTGAR
jgi:hypothetical protein